MKKSNQLEITRQGLYERLGSCVVSLDSLNSFLEDEELVIVSSPEKVKRWHLMRLTELKNEKVIRAEIRRVNKEYVKALEAGE